MESALADVAERYDTLVAHGTVLEPDEAEGASSKLKHGEDTVLLSRWKGVVDNALSSRARLGGIKAKFREVGVQISNVIHSITAWWACAAQQHNT